MIGAAPQPTARTVLLRAKLAHVRGHDFGPRAARFRKTSGEPAPEIDLADLTALPDWILLDDDAQVQVGLAAAILDARGAIDRELSGARLAAIAELVGDGCFERLCELPLPDNARSEAPMRLPRPEDLAETGRRLRLAALPGVPIDTGVAMIDPAKARALCDLAAKLIDAGEVCDA